MILVGGKTKGEEDNNIIIIMIFDENLIQQIKF
jgi:hypothetical protein